MPTLDVMPDLSEVVHYDEPGVPLYIRQGRLTRYPNLRAECHWHDDLEFIRVLEGRMHYSVNGKTVALEEGDCLFVNARHLHYGFDWDMAECVFTCVLIHPELLTPSARLYDAYLGPFIRDAGVPYMKIPASEPDGRCAAILGEVWKLKEEQPPGYQIMAANLLSLLTVSLLRTCPQTGAEEGAQQDQKLLAQKKMVAYIAKNYASEMSLEDIAGSASVSKSTCCRLFRQYVRQTPFEFLNDYRLRVAQALLTGTDRSVTEIATLCGFSNASYFTKLFRESYGVSPGKYRRSAAT